MPKVLAAPTAALPSTDPFPVTGSAPARDARFGTVLRGWLREATPNNGDPAEPSDAPSGEPAAGSPTLPGWPLLFMVTVTSSEEASVAGGPDREGTRGAALPIGAELPTSAGVSVQDGAPLTAQVVADARRPTGQKGTGVEEQGTSGSSGSLDSLAAAGEGGEVWPSPGTPGFAGVATLSRPASEGSVVGERPSLTAIPLAYRVGEGTAERSRTPSLAPLGHPLSYEGGERGPSPGLRERVASAREPGEGGMDTLDVDGLGRPMDGKGPLTGAETVTDAALTSASRGTAMPDADGAGTPGTPSTPSGMAALGPDGAGQLAAAALASSPVGVMDTSLGAVDVADQAARTGAASSQHGAAPVDVLPTAAPRPSAVAQVAAALALSARDGVTEVTIALRPPELGEVRARIVTGPDGLVIRLSAEREAVGALLRARAGELQQALTAQQLSVAEVHVLHNPPPAPASTAPDWQGWQERWWLRREPGQQERRPGGEGTGREADDEA
jgi:hypothetical protein